MRRFILIALGSCVLVLALFVAFNSSLRQSMADRAVRLVEWIVPGWGPIARHGSRQPLATRLGEKGFALGAPAFIRILKQENELEVWLRKGETFALFETFPICTWSGDLGPKLAEGDKQSPEGFYAVGLKQLNPKSSYYRAFNLGFPNAYDQTFGRTGSLLMVHGDCVSIGCYAMTDKGIDDIYRIVEAALLAGQNAVPVHAFPFRMTDTALAAKAGHRWASYWANLKEGYDLFETTKVPPNALVCGQRYTFSPSAAESCKPIIAW